VATRERAETSFSGRLSQRSADAGAPVNGTLTSVPRAKQADLVTRALEMQKAYSRKHWFDVIRPTGLFGKYVMAFVGLVVLVLAVNGGLETWFTYVDRTELLAQTQSEKAEATASRIQQFMNDLERQISWATRASATTIEQRRADYIQLLQQIPSIERLIYLDGNGKEQLRVTRAEVVLASGIDYSGNSRFTEAQGHSIWISPVYFDGPDPFVSIAMPHSGRNSGSTVAEVSLRFLANYLDANEIGKNYRAYVVGPKGRLLADSDSEHALGTDFENLPQIKNVIDNRKQPLIFGTDPDGTPVLTASAAVPRLTWFVFFEQPRSAALQPVYNIWYRTTWILGLGVLLAVVAGMLLARQMVIPIRALQVGAQQIEASDFGHRIELRQADEIADLAAHFNRMADRLQNSYSRLEQKVAERTRELAQSVSELKALEEIGRAVASSLDLNSVLSTIVTRAVQLTQADAGAVYRYDPARGSFELAEAHALEKSIQDAIRAVPVRFDESVLGNAAKEGHSIAVPDLANAPNYPLREITLQAGFHSVLVVPLLAQDEILGGLVLHRRSAGDFPDSTVQIMQTFAHQSVLAMTNARLFWEVEQKGRELAIANEHKSQFFATMSHELRTPLNGMLGFTELLLDGLYGALPEKALEVLARVLNDGKHLLGLINDVLDISKIDAGQLTLSLEDYSLPALVENVVASTASLARAKGLEVKTEVPSILPIAHGDERRITQVLLNVVGNAIKFTDSGSVVIRAKLVDNHFTIAVQDTGPGIPLSDQGRIFEEFQQADSSSTRQKGGTGLGLSISRRLIRAHGGHIDVYSMPGHGSTFNIVLPVRATEQRQAA
jgi:signal transduction histidine kinase